MSRLKSLLRAGLREERGSVSSLVLVLFASGFVLALVALLIDSGALYAQRRVSQVSADQVAVAFAKWCATSGDECNSSGNSAKVDAILNSASAGHPVAVSEVCGSADNYVLRPAMPVCAEGKNFELDCETPDLTTNPQFARFVRVRTDASGSGRFTLLHGLKDPSLSSANTPACSQYAWGKANSMPIANNVLPLAFAPCELRLAALSVNAVMNDATSSACSLQDFESASFSSTLHGMLRFEAGAASGPCAVGSSLEVGETVCLSNRDANSTGIYYLTKLSSLISTAYTTKAKNLLPVVFVKNSTTVSDGSKGSFATANVAGFVEVTVKGYKSGSTVVGAAPTSGWASACATTGNLCVNGTLAQRISTKSAINLSQSIPNFGVTALSPMP